MSFKAAPPSPTKTVLVEPVQGDRLPFDLSDENPSSYMEELAVAANTAELQASLGADFGVATAYERKAQADLLKKSLKDQDAAPLRSLPVAYSAAAFLRTYGSHLALDVASVRSAITHKLIALADCGDPKYELKALELLGKHSDIGLFTERSEVTINYKDPAALEDAIKERIKRLLNADVIDAVPLYATIDDELGHFDEWSAKKEEEKGEAGE